MFEYIKGIIDFEIIVPDPNSFINIIKESCITVEAVQLKKGKITGQIYKKDFIEFKNICNLCNAQMCIVNQSGLVYKIEKYKKRIGIAIGVMISVLMLFFFSDTVMIVEVYGNENISDKEILSLANDTGIYIGANISELDLRKAERILVSSSDKISWAGIRSSGCKIQIEVDETYDAPELVEHNIPCNIVSSKDAQIVEIKNIYSGMLVQMLNNGVKKGDLLISGIVEDGKGGVYYTHSFGEIIGRYTEVISFTQKYIDDSVSYKEKEIEKDLHFFGLRIPLHFGNKVFETYESDEDVTYFEVFGIKFPIGIIYSEYRPYNVKQVEYTEEQVKGILNDKINMYESNFLNKDDIKIISKEAEYIKINGGIKVIVRYSIEGNIGICKEIMVK